MGITNHPQFNDFLDGVGRLTLSWGQLELGIDGCVILIHKHWGGAQTVETQRPRALERKLTYLKKAYRKIPALPAIDNIDMCEMLDNISAAAVMRHDLVHGIALGTSSHGFEVTRLLHKEERFRNVTIVPRDVLMAAVSAGKMAEMMLTLVQRLAVPPQ